MTLNEYQEKALRTATQEMTADELYPALGMAGEAGEFADLVKKYRYQGHPRELERLIEEAGDVLWNVAVAAASLGVSLEGLAKYNIKKLEKRYPDGFDAERSVHREEYQ